MTPAFKQFMTGIIDYAGMFPPAALDPGTALKNYRTYLGTEFRWMLNNFILPVSKLSLTEPADDLSLSVIIKDPVSEDEKKMLSQWAPRIQALETVLPEKPDTPSEVAACLEDFRAQAAGAGRAGIFVETTGPERFSTVIEVLARINRSSSGGRFGFKLRCGGADKAAVPSPERVAAVIASCRDHDIPLKFTAGLHHPFFGFSESLGTVRHGFINIFSAALLAFSCSLCKEEIRACLTDGNKKSFVFSGTGFSWQGRSVGIDAIERLRREKVIGFGSCSFEEPLADLVSLKLL
ncbi:MAG: hypothetical protein MI863_07245 [Desulfobacterales bacterium]|nr:hypothetical protein [Desulfobacterales bacterium]